MGDLISCSFIGPVGPTTIYTTAVVDLTLLVRVWYNMTKDTRLSVIPFAKNVSLGQCVQETDEGIILCIEY